MTAPSSEALFRYQVVSQVLVRIHAGETAAEAVRHVAVLDHPAFDGPSRRVSVRALYRWMAAFRSGGIAALEPARRVSAITALPKSLLDFLREQKALDPKASLPELIRRARRLSIIPQNLRIDRSTVYRAAKRLKISVARRKGAGQRDARRFAYPHRMNMVLCDGNHFRAGATRKRRVAFFFLDDCSRFGLHVVVGTSETKDLFLRGLYETIRAFGLMSILYVDRGSGFIAEDTIHVTRNLNILLVHGEAGYPEGRGKIERFNRTANAAVLDGLDGRADVDSACPSLELRLQHYHREIYNHSPHESLSDRPPSDVFHGDPKTLEFPRSDEALRLGFVVHHGSRVSPDNVVSVDGIAYEMPRGHAGERVILHRHVLDRQVFVIHDGRSVQLHPVDLAQNAKTPRTKGPAKEDDAGHVLPPSAADLAFQKDFHPVVDEDGGVIESDQESTP